MRGGSSFDAPSTPPFRPLAVLQMILRLQPDELIYSYVARSYFLNGRSQATEWLDSVQRWGHLTRFVLPVAAAQEWPGVYGFNRLLHDHTSYPLTSFLKHDRDLSYSGFGYCEDLFWQADRKLSFCPTCVKEDHERYGFSYWRRDYSSRGNLICAEHNVVRLTDCPYCGKPFLKKENHLKVMWTGCCGFSLADVPPTANTDAVAFRKAKLYRDILSSKYHLPTEIVLEVIRSKLTQVDINIATKCVDSLRKPDRLEILTEILDRNRNKNVFYHLSMYNSELLDCIVELYDDFDSLVADVSSKSRHLRPINSLWDTYMVAETSTGQFISEDYRYGVGRWSVSFSKCGVNDGIFRDRRTVVFKCCQMQLAGTREWKNLQNVDLAAANVPRLSQAAYEELLKAQTSWPRA